MDAPFSGNCRTLLKILLFSQLRVSNWIFKATGMWEVMQSKAAVQLTIIQQSWTTTDNPPLPTPTPTPTTCRTYYHRLSWSVEHKAQKRNTHTQADIEGDDRKRNKLTHIDGLLTTFFKLMTIFKTISFKKLVCSIGLILKKIK